MTANENSKKENQTNFCAVKNTHWLKRGIETIKQESPTIANIFGSLFIKSNRKTAINSVSCGLRSI